MAVDRWFTTHLTKGCGAAAFPEQRDEPHWITGRNPTPGDRRRLHPVRFHERLHPHLTIGLRNAETPDAVRPDSGILYPGPVKSGSLSMTPQNPDSEWFGPDRSG